MLLTAYKSVRTLTFTDTFSAGSLNANVWMVTTGPSPSTAGEANGSFVANAVSLSQGCLQLSLTQNSVCSLGGQISTANTFGYGLYEFDVRPGSTSTTPTGVGTSVSGGVSGAINFINNSNTEIDIEVQGQSPNELDVTTWQTLANSQSSVSYLNRLSDAERTLAFLWLPTSVSFFVDGLCLHVHSIVVPTQPAPIVLNHWGTNSANVGGLKTVGTRYAYCTAVRFYAN